MKYQKMDEKLKAELRNVVLLARYRTLKPTVKPFKYATYRIIAKLVNLTEYEVQHICRKALKNVKPPSNKHEDRKLEQKHIDYLLSSKTLE